MIEKMGLSYNLIVNIFYMEIGKGRYIMKVWRDWPAKSAHSPEMIEHPVIYHMLDVAAVAECLIAPFHFSSPLKQAFVALAGLHDLGKFSETFRSFLRNGEPQPKNRRHWELTEALFYKEDGFLASWLGGKKILRKFFYASIAGHHGRPPGFDIRLALDDCTDCIGEGQEPARIALEFFASLWPEASLDEMDREQAASLSWWLPGFCTASDWLGSNMDWFPAEELSLSPQDYLAQARIKACKAIEQAGLGQTAPSSGPLFGFTLRPLQAACQELSLTDGPMLAILEDETGSGKTEAALLLAQRMILAGKGRGLFFALPTMATADAMFDRLVAFAGNMFVKPSLALAHGRAKLSSSFKALIGGTDSQAGRDNDSGVSSTDWLADTTRRALLADVGVGTIDQAFLSLLPVRFQTLRQYGLSSKILIVDEAHQVGEGYEGEELKKLLERHYAMGGSAIVLTATLPLEWRQKLLATYGGGVESRAYPAITVAGGETVTTFAPDDRPKKGSVHVERLSRSEAAVAHLVEAHARGSASVWIRNAVDDAIEAVELLRARGIEAHLLHARFALCDRKHIEQVVQAHAGRDGIRREGFVLVGTQILESSLDLDFDEMVSDLAPVAALIQRAGRLWRHMDVRPAKNRPVAAPVLHLLSPDPAELVDERCVQQTLGKGAWVYGLPELWRTATVLLKAEQITAPEGLRELIEQVHGDNAIETPQILLDIEGKRLGKVQAQRALAYQNMVNFRDGYRQAGRGDDDISYPTRLGDETRILALARRTEAGLLPWANEGTDETKRLDMAWTLSEVSVRCNRLKGFELPDQDSPEMEVVKREWPAWRQKAVTICPVAENGEICEGLRYKADIGLIFSSPPSG